MNSDTKRYYAHMILEYAFRSMRACTLELLAEASATNNKSSQLICIQRAAIQLLSARVLCAAVDWVIETV